MLESSLHKRYKELRTFGEWFTITEQEASLTFWRKTEDIEVFVKPVVDYFDRKNALKNLLVKEVFEAVVYSFLTKNCSFNRIDNPIYFCSRLYFLQLDVVKRCINMLLNSCMSNNIFVELKHDKGLLMSSLESNLEEEVFAIFEIFNKGIEYGKK